MPIALPTPPPGLPGAAYQPFGGVGLPGDAYMGAGALPTGGAPAGGLSPYAQQLMAMQGSVGQPLGTMPSPLVEQQMAAWNQAPAMFSRAGDAAPSMQAPQPRSVPQSPMQQSLRVQSNIGQAVRPGPVYGPPSMPSAPTPGGTTAIKGPVSAGPSNPQAGANLMEVLTGQRPGPTSSNPPPPTGPSTAATATSSSRFPRLGKVANSAGWMATNLLGQGALEWTRNRLDPDKLENTPFGRVMDMTMRGTQGGMLAGPYYGTLGGVGSGAGQFGLEMQRAAADPNDSALSSAALDTGLAALESAPIIGAPIQAIGIADKLNSLFGDGDANTIAELSPGASAIMDGYGQGGGESGDQAQAQQQAIADLPGVMSNLGISDRTARTALDQLDQNRALFRVYAENGIPIPGAADENGEPLVLTPDQVDAYASKQFLMSLPELIDVERQQQEALARTAAFQAMIGNTMAPYQQEANALADLYPALLGNVPNMPAEVAGPMQNLAGIYGANVRRDANAYGAMGQMIPTQAALDQRQALQAQLDQMLQSQMLRDMVDSGQASEDDLAAATLGG